MKHSFQSHDSTYGWAFETLKGIALENESKDLKAACAKIQDFIFGYIDGDQLQKGYLEQLRKIEVEIDQNIKKLKNRS